jgi:hypothetical protein
LRFECAAAASEGKSLGVYRVDYRGFAQLAGKGVARLSVDYRFGPNKVKRFERRVRGPTSEDFVFTENIGAGLMKRAGCGADTSLDMRVGLRLDTGASSGDMAVMDSSDGAPRGVVYYLDLKDCAR